MNDNPFATKLQQTIAETISDEQTAAEIAANVHRLLNREKLLYYADPGRIQLMSNHGRVLIAILEDPGVTQRALSVYLRVSESNVQKSLRALLKDGIIRKKKRGNRNHYEFNPSHGFSHPDVNRFLETLVPQYSGWRATQRTPHPLTGSPTPDTHPDH